MFTKKMNQWFTGKYFTLVLGMLLLIAVPGTWAASGSEGVFRAVATDPQGIKTDLENVIFYWEEKVSETAFIPHELRELPVKRGASTVKIQFDAMKSIILKPSGNGSPPEATVSLKNGKTGEFTLAIMGSFKGQSDFGEVDLPATQLSSVVFK